jgi:hypothetical protein
MLAFGRLSATLDRMSAAEILAELPRLSPEEIATIRRRLEKGEVRSEVSGTGVRPPGYDALFGCLADDETFEIPERHPWRPAPKFD